MKQENECQSMFIIHRFKFLCANSKKVLYKADPKMIDIDGQNHISNIDRETLVMIEHDLNCRPKPILSNVVARRKNKSLVYESLTYTYLS